MTPWIMMTEVSQDAAAEETLRTLEAKRMVEAILFAAQRPLTVADIAARLPSDTDIPAILATLEDECEGRGFVLVQRGGRWQFQTAPDMAFLLSEEVDQTRRLSKAAIETLAIIAYHQPITRSEIEEMRGVSLSRGTLDVLLEAEWIRPRGRKQVPGRPVLYATTSHFLAHFGLEDIGDLPGLAELRAAGLLDPVEQALDRMLEEATAQASSGEDAAPDEFPEETGDEAL